MWTDVSRPRRTPVPDPSAAPAAAHRSSPDMPGGGARMILAGAIQQFVFHCRYEKNLSPREPEGVRPFPVAVNVRRSIHLSNHSG